MDTHEPYRFHISPGWITHVWKSALRHDHDRWRPTIARHLPVDGVALDVGAHGGQFTRLLAGIATAGRVVAIEPSGYARSVLRATIWLRGARNVIIVAAAVGDAPDVAMLCTPIKPKGDMGYGLAHLGTNATTRAGRTIVEPVAVVTIDTIVERLALDRVDFLKADIEGHEGAMLAGARRTIDKHRPTLLLEQDPNLLRRAGWDLARMWTDLTQLGYRPHAMRTDGIKPLAVDEPSEGDILWIAT